MAVTQRLDLPKQECAKAPPVRLGLGMCRMVGVGECEIGREVPTASEVRVRDELVEPVEEPEQPGSGFRGAGQRVLVPRQILVGGAPEDRRNQAVLAAEVLVERPAGDVRLLEQRVDADRGAAGVEELLARGEQSFPGSRGGLGAHLLVLVLLLDSRTTSL